MNLNVERTPILTYKWESLQVSEDYALVGSNVLNNCEQLESLIQYCRRHSRVHSPRPKALCWPHRIGTLPMSESNVRGWPSGLFNRNSTDSGLRNANGKMFLT